MKKIDVSQWDRFETYQYFMKLDHPRYLMTFDLDVTKFYHMTKKNHQSFYLSFIHFIMTILNKYDSFKYRMIDDEVIYYDKIHPSFTDLIEGTDRFKFITINYEVDCASFITHAKEKSLRQGNQFVDLEQEERQDLVYITTFPWASFTQVTHAGNDDPKDAIPRLVWGKFRDVDGKLWMPFSIEVHHAFVDGYHLGLFIQEVMKNLENL